MKYISYTWFFLKIIEYLILELIIFFVNDIYHLYYNCKMKYVLYLSFGFCIKTPISLANKKRNIYLNCSETARWRGFFFFFFFVFKWDPTKLMKSNKFRKIISSIQREFKENSIRFYNWSPILRHVLNYLFSENSIRFYNWSPILRHVLNYLFS